MTTEQGIDLYTDYLIVSTGATTATGLSSLLDGQVSHDEITRLLSSHTYTSKELWLQVKSVVRQMEDAQTGVLIIDDHIEEKAYSRENDLLCWHYDHCLSRSVKGVNQVTGLLYSKGMSVPIGFEMVKKTKIVVNPKTGKEKRVSEVTKNEHYRSILKQAVQNQVQFRYVANDCWFTNQENMRYIKQELKKDFVMALKSNTNVWFKTSETQAENYQALGNLTFKAGEVKAVCFKELDFLVNITKVLFTDEKGKEHVLYLATSDLSLTVEQIIEIYQKRWKVEEFHKSMKSNLGFAKSPTHTVGTQQNHFFFCMLAFVKLERIRLKLRSNHFALKEKLYRSGLKKAFQELRAIKSITIAKAA